MRKLTLIFALMAVILPFSSYAEGVAAWPEGENPIIIEIEVPGLKSSECIGFGWHWKNEDFGLLNGGILGYLDSLERKVALGLPWNAQLSALHYIERIIRFETARREYGLPPDATRQEIEDRLYHTDYHQESIKEYDLPADATEEDVRQARLARWQQEDQERAAQVAADTEMLREEHNLPYSNEAMAALELGLPPTSTAAEINHAVCMLELRLQGERFGLQRATTWQEVLEAAEQ